MSTDYPAGTILGVNGSPISSRQFLSASVNRDPSWPIRALDPLKKLITNRDWLTTSYLSSKLYANVGVIRGIIDEKAMLAIGNAWSPFFVGGAGDERAKEWGKRVTDWLIEQWCPYCDVRGPNFDFATGLFLDSITIDRDGDAFCLFTRSEGGNGKWPMVQHIPPRQIGQWNSASSGSADVIIADGPFKGAILRNGVIMNRQEQPIGFRKLGDNRDEFEDIPASVIDQRFEPQWYDQARGLPVISASVENIRKSITSEDFEQQAMMIASSIGLIEWNEHGGPDPGDPSTLFRANDDGTPSGVQVKQVMGSVYRYLKANSGAKLEQFHSPRPAQEWENFQDRQVRSVCAGAGWDSSYAWKRESVNGTSMRAVLEKIRASVADRQVLLKPRALRKIQWAVSVAIKEGIIPPYPGADLGGFLKWDFTKPPELSIDPGRDWIRERDEFLLGITSEQSMHARRGTTMESVREAQDTAVDDLLTRARKHADKHDISFDLALALLQQRTPNGNAAPAEEAPAPEPPPTDTPPKEGNEE